MRLTLYFIFGGLGAGCIIAAYLLAMAGGISKGDLILPDLTGGAVIAVALACVWLPAQPRLRNLGLIIRPTPSWIAFETYAAMAFFLALATVAKVPAPAIELMVVLSAALFLYCQTHVAQASKSRSAWRAAEIPSLLAITGLTGGVGLLALLTAIVPAVIRAVSLAPIAGMVLAMMGAYRWRDYVTHVDETLRHDLQSVAPQIYGAAYALPFILYAAALFPWEGRTWMAPLGGLAAIVGTSIWMNTLIARLGRAREFTASPVGV